MHIYMYLLYTLYLLYTHTNIYNRFYPCFMLSKFLEGKYMYCAIGHISPVINGVCPVHINYYNLGSDEVEKTGQVLHLIQQSQMERTCPQRLSLILTPQEIP